jgi:MFS family permease
MSNAQVSNQAIAPNANRLLIAGFMAILAAGVGFSIRAGILGDWGTQFGFTQTELGQITGGGLVGFGIIILLGALIADAVGYGRLMIFAFIMHFLSAIITLAATPIFKATGNKDAAYWCLYIGMFMFAIGNGTAEAVVNPLVATLFPKNKTHYLNILHAGWPGGLVVGGLASYFMVSKVSWEIQMTLFMIPVVFYGALCLGQKFPKSEASIHGVKFGEMLAEFAAPILLLLLFIHALLGYVELGTDSWISNITGNILASREKGLLLFVYTSTLMFALRFFAGPIVEKISPLGLLFAGAACGAIGLILLGYVQTGLLVVIAATVYGIGKTFLWPTMLAVVSERFPKGGAITIGAMGGVGMLSAGLLGGPGIGYNQDHHAAKTLQEKAPAVYEQYKSPTSNRFLVWETQGLDGTKVGGVRAKAPDARTAEEKQVHEADLHGGRMALKITAAIPALMAVLYLFLIIYFKSKGGYTQVHIVGSGRDAREVGDAQQRSPNVPA